MSGKPQSTRMHRALELGNSIRAPTPTECFSRMGLEKLLNALPLSKKATPARKSTESSSTGRERYSRLAAKKSLPMNAPDG